MSEHAEGQYFYQRAFSNWGIVVLSSRKLVDSRDLGDTPRVIVVMFFYFVRG